MIRRLALPIGLALVIFFLALLPLAVGLWTPQAAWAATSAVPPPGDYRAYLPLVMHTLGPELCPDDPGFEAEWGLEVVEATKAWRITCGASTVLVAVLDSGTDLDHPDLAGKLRTDIDRDFVNDDYTAEDDHGHGTHVSGIAAAATNNGVGVAGLGWEVSILPVKVLNSSGGGDSLTLADAIRYAADAGAAAINMSLGGPVPCPTHLQDAVDYAYDRGVVLVAAAGNHGDEPNAEMFPANCEHVLGVAATEPDDSIASYSNYGSHVSVAAPGSSIYNTLMGGGYGYKWGTSMATPHVAGLAALLRSHYPSYTPDQIASAMLDTAEDLGTPGWDPDFGCGRINAYRALSQGAQGSAPVCLQGVGTWEADGDEVESRAAIVPGEVIVSFRPGVNAGQAALRHGDASPEFLRASGLWRLHVAPGHEQALLARLQADPAVIRAELNYKVTHH